MAAAAAEELGPAVAADGLVEDVHVAEERRQFRIGHAVIDVADDIVVLADELMTGIDVAVGDDAHVFMAGTTAAQALGDAGTAIEVHDEVVINEGPAFIHAFQVEIGQAVVFFINAGQVIIGDGIGQVVADDGFHGQAFKAEVSHVFYVFGEIEIVFCIRPADVIFFTVAVFRRIDLIVGTGLVRAVTAGIGTHAVVYFRTTVEAQDEADVIIRQILDLGRVEEHAVRRQGQLEYFIVDLFLFPDVLDGLLDDAEVHQRFAAEEVDFAVLAFAFGALDEQVDSVFGYVEAHEFPLVRIVIALGGKAVLTAQVAIVGNVQAERFDDRFFFGDDLEVFRHRCKEHFLFDELIQFAQGFVQILFIIRPGKGLIDSVFIGTVIDVEDIVGHLVDDVDDAAVDVEEHVRPVLTVFMNHWFNFSHE